MTEKKTAKSESETTGQPATGTSVADSEGLPASDVPEVDRLNEQLRKAEQELAEYKDQLMRTMADFQNFRKRTRDEQRLIQQLANERLIIDLLPVLDNFERAIAGAESGSKEALIDGVKAIDRQFRNVLDTQKVKRVESIGQPFDPEHHDALALVESTEHEEGTVIEEVESGYKIGDRVIRPARVRVTKKP